MRYLAVLFLFAVLGNGLLAQANQDSLLAIWNNESEDVEVRLKSILDFVSIEQRAGNMDTCLYFLKLHAELAKKHDLEK